MKKSVFKILTIIICSLILLNFVLPNVTSFVYAETAAQQEETREASGHDTLLGAVADGVVGLLTWPLRVLIVIFGEAMRLVIGGIASVSGGQFNINISPEDILFNKLQITDINFFDFNNNLSDGVLTIRKNIAIWYYALRNLAIGILLVILVYVGIRMAISTVASEEARYKTMLKDWVVSFVLVFLLQYIIIFTINANNALVDILQNALQNVSHNGGFSNVVNTFGTNGLKPLSFTMGFGSAIAFCILVGVTLSFLIFYIKRMLTLAFLIIISPIVTITYSIDKMGDNQSQALNKWVKEFVYTVLIQPFQCLIYIVFATTAIDLMQDMTLGAAILGCVMILFIHQAEDIVRGIFSFEHAHHLGNTFMNLAIINKLGEGLNKVGSAASNGNAANAKAAGAVPTQGAGGTGTSAPQQTNQARNNVGGTATAATPQNNKINKGFYRGSGQSKIGNAKAGLSRAKAGAARLANTKPGKILGLHAKVASSIAFTAMGGGTAGMEGAFAGHTLAKGISNVSSTTWHNAANAQAQKDAASAQVGQAYNNYVQQQGLQNNPTQARLDYNRIARDVLNGKNVNAFDADEQQLAQSLAQFKTTFEQMGKSQQNIAEEMERTLTQMQKAANQTAQNTANGGGGSPSPSPAPGGGSGSPSPSPAPGGGSGSPSPSPTPGGGSGSPSPSPTPGGGSGTSGTTSSSSNGNNGNNGNGGNGSGNGSH